MPPLPVSVVIPAHRRADEVRRAVQSVKRQTAAPAEVLVVDDASGDDTGEAARDAGATVVTLEANVGEGGARNAGIAAATHDWVALLDSDDEWLPEHLERLWPARGDHVLVGTACLGVGPGPLAGRILGWAGPGPRVLRAPTDVAWPENTITSSSVMVRREAILAAGGFPAPSPQAADFDTWLRVLEQGTGVVLPEVTAIYHLHGEQASRDRRGMHVSRIGHYNRYRERPWYDSRLVDRMTAVDAWDMRDPRMLGAVLVRPQGALGLLQMFAYRRRKRRLSRGHAGLPS